ncbi:hypothetical protein AB0L04_28810 [Streptomyces glaucescens]|uniref:hypothetical protein n=1 Tax=Streptomyces glaucescens TaxID=1907 RepID=UPI00344B4094
MPAESQFAQLQQKVGTRHAEVLKPFDGDQLAVEYARLVKITSELLEFEKTISECLGRTRWTVEGARHWLSLSPYGCALVPCP